MELEQMSDEQLRELLASQPAVYIQREVLYELRRREQQHAQSVDTDFYWGLQEQAVREYVGNFTEGRGLSHQARRAIATRMVNFMLEHEIVFYQEGEEITEQRGFDAMLYTIMSLYPSNNNWGLDDTPPPPTYTNIPPQARAEQTEVTFNKALSGTARHRARREQIRRRGRGKGRR